MAALLMGGQTTTIVVIIQIRILAYMVSSADMISDGTNQANWQTRCHIK